MIKYACDMCESVENISRMSFTTGSIKLDNGEGYDYTIEDLDVCDLHIRMLAQYLLNRLTRKEEWEEQIAAYKYLQTIAKNNKNKQEGIL